MEVPQIVAGRFRIENEIGRGGMGTVYGATHIELERLVAIKILKPEFSAQKELADRILREARTMAKLRHPRAAMVFDAGRLEDGRPFIVMEYVQGRTLADTLAREHRLSPERAVRIAIEICEALAEAHALGIVHRDLKPSNIMLGARGAVVLDFGVAKMIQTATEATHTHATTESGVIVGTPRYMSPEQCTGLPIGPASDLYSLGVVLYEMLAGRPPFVDPLPSAILVKQATAPPPPLPRFCPAAPPELVRVVHALLAKSASDRPRSANEAKRMLERCLRREPAEETPPLAATIASLNARPAAARLGVLISLVLLFGALLVGAMNFRTANSEATTLRHEPEQPGSTALPTPLPAATLSPSKLQTTARRSVSFDISEQRGRLVLTIARKGTRFASTKRIDLGSADWRDARWTVELSDIDGDGEDEVLCLGVRRTRQRRLVLYAPRTDRSYSVEIRSPHNRNSAQRLIWSASAAAREAAPFRAALHERARTLVAQF